MEIIVALSFFVLGLISGAFGVVALVILIGKRAMNRRAKEEPSDKKKLTLDERMDRIKEIGMEQLDLASRADGPQKNALDGKYKNSLISRLKALDEEKNDILASILTDGHDPELTTMDNSGVITKMKLSEYMAYMGMSVKPKPPEKKNMGKFTIHRGGKDDGGSTTH